MRLLRQQGVRTAVPEDLLLTGGGGSKSLVNEEVMMNVHVSLRNQYRSFGAATLGAMTALLSSLPAAAWAQVSTYQTIRVVDPIVNNADPTLNASDRNSDSEDSIAINPQNPRELVLLGFAESF